MTFVEGFVYSLNIFDKTSISLDYICCAANSKLKSDLLPYFDNFEFSCVMNPDKIFEAEMVSQQCQFVKTPLI